jgi:serpin B
MVSKREAPVYRALAVIIMAALIGCESVSRSSSETSNSNSTANTNSTIMEEQKKPSTDKVDPRLVAANTKFGMKLYTEVLGQSAGKNVFVSPSSVGICLAMVYNGAAGETREAMARALEASGFSLEELNRAYADLKASLQNPDPKVQLEIANSLWARQGLTFKQDFINRNKQFFEAEMTALNFDDPGAAGTINSWVKDKTKGKIDKIVDQISPDSIMFLINAIYFKGKWSKEFDKAATK